ncbi:MAG TPA: T9SS type A sorting domain-containing protein [Edaphocola sp.]|nr:T9SS type A sorting domain-containing protein [Edaphocola sp.]
MMNTITGVKPALLMAALAVLLPLWAAAQQVTVNRVYDFSGNTDTFNSQINYVYADSNQIIALGEAYPDSAKPYAFTAAFDYSGNLLWQKPIRLPNDLYPIDSGFNNLIKVKPGLYVAGGNIANAPKESTYVSNEPFLYFFNAQGDSIRLLYLKDSLMDQRLTTLTVGDHGNIIVGGSNNILDSTNTSLSPGNYWFTELDNFGNIINQKSIPLSAVYYGLPYFPPRPNPAITNIIPASWDSIHYVVASNYYFPMESGVVFMLDSAFNLRAINQQLHFHDLPPGVHIPSVELVSRGPFEFNFIPHKGDMHSFFWSFPASHIVTTSNDYGYGIYFCMAHFNLTNGYHLNWYQTMAMGSSSIMPSYSAFDKGEQGRSTLSEAINGDLLVQREITRIIDTLSPATTYNSYHFPLLLRAGDTGHLKWGMSFQYVHTVDTGIYHSFYDVSVAPDGRIVMGGFLRSRYAVPGYDTIGKVSWLVVLSDTLHDQQPQPTEPDGIALTATGQQAQLLVYPNPTLDNTTIDVQDFKGRPRDFEWQLSDITGRLLQSGRLSANREMIRLEGYMPGLYLLRLNYKGKPAAVVKILKE